MAPTYAQRLRAEGTTLVAVGAAGSAALLATTPQAKRQPLNTVGQLAAVAAGLGVLGPRSTAKALAGARRVRFGRVGTGEPTPLWHIPLPILGGVLFVSVVGRKLLAPLPLPEAAKEAPGWDAALRVTAGGALVGAYQALVIAPQVERAQGRRRTYYRMPGSRLARGTALGYTKGRPRAS